MKTKDVLGRTAGEQMLDLGMCARELDGIPKALDFRQGEGRGRAGERSAAGGPG